MQDNHYLTRQTSHTRATLDDILKSKIMRKLTGFFITSMLLVILFLIYKFGHEVYLKYQYPHPELYSEDSMALSEYCGKRITICEPSLVCKLRDIGAPVGGLIVCGTKAGGTKGLTR